MGFESPRNKAAAAQQEIKKKTSRFSKDELLELRKPSAMPAELASVTDVLSAKVLDPVCYTRFEHEDVSVEMRGIALRGGGVRFIINFLFLFYFYNSFLLLFLQ